MLDLFKSEFKRYSTAAYLTYIAQIFLWVMIGKMTVILAPASSKHSFLMISSLLAGLAFALVSMSLHKRKNHWTYLVHRPLSTRKIHLSLSGAALSLLVIGFVLPFLSVIIFLDLFSSNLVELRHYLYCLHMLAVITVAYFVGSFIILSPSKFAFLSVWIVSYLIFRAQTPVAFDLFIDLIFVLFSFYLAVKSFKTNLSEFSQDNKVIFVSAVALQPALLFILFIAQTAYYHFPLMLLGSHPSMLEEAETFKMMQKKSRSERFTQILDKGDHPEKEQIKRQVTLSEFKSLPTKNFQLPYKGQLFLKDNSFNLSEEDNDNIWVFSHQKMLLEGRALRSGKRLGYLAVNGFFPTNTQLSKMTAFDSAPVLFARSNIQTKNNIYSVDFKNQKVTTIHQLSNGEYYVGPVSFMFDMAVLKTNQSLIFIDRDDFINPDVQATEIFKVPHPVNFDRQFNVEVTEVLNGFVALYTSFDYFGFNRPGASMTYLRHGGELEHIASFEFQKKHLPDLIYFQGFMFSPILLNLVDANLNSVIQFQGKQSKEFAYFWQQNHSTSIYLFCLFAAIFSAVISYLVGRKLPLKKSNLTLWVCFNLIAALPGLLAFLMLNRWKNALISKNNPTGEMSKRNDKKTQSTHGEVSC